MAATSIFLGCPLSDGRIDVGAARSIFSTATQVHNLMVVPHVTSLLCANFNALWCHALNARESSHLKWFAMLHSDIEPEYWWLDKLIAEADKHGADLLSAVVPVKNVKGLTSTAIARPGSRFTPFCRLTMQQVRHQQFPDTFDIHGAAEALERLPGDLRIEHVPREALLVNTGCFVCRIDQPWSENVWFTIHDGIERIDGKWTAVAQSEDWTFSRLVAGQGARVMATRTIALAHKGGGQFLSHQTWGEANDRGCRL